MNQVSFRPRSNLVLLLIGATGIALTFLFQDFYFSEELVNDEVTRFIFRKTLRVLLNDVFMLLIIYAWFNDRQVTRLALFIQLVDGAVLLPLYLILKLTIEGSSEISSPLLSQLHRLIINPTLMILLIPAIYFQRLARRNE